MTELHKTACPVCRSQGNDSRGDNLAVYKDGHSYCYACGYHIPIPATIESVKDKLVRSKIKTYESKCDDLPTDISSVLPLVSKTWLMKYDFTVAEMANFWWSEDKQQLIFPVFSDEGLLLFWQARNFSPKVPFRYYTSGSLYDEVLVLGDTGDSSRCILVEDVVSAIKLARTCLAIPLFGTHITREQLIYIRDVAIPTGIKKLSVWLDADKTMKAIEIKNQAAELGMNTSVIISAHDPKCYQHTEVWRFIKEQG